MTTHSKAPRITFNSTGDLGLKIEDGKVAWAEDGTQATQHAVQRLSRFYGDWILDQYRDVDLEKETHPKRGTKWYEVIFKADKGMVEKELEIRTRIIDTPGIQRIERWYKPTITNHTLTVGSSDEPVKVITDWGEEDLSLDLTLL